MTTKKEMIAVMAFLLAVGGGSGAYFYFKTFSQYSFIQEQTMSKNLKIQTRQSLFQELLV